MLASTCAIIAAATWLVLYSFQLVNLVSKAGKVQTAAVEASKTVVSVIFLVSLVFASAQTFIENVGSTSETTSTIREIEFYIFWLNRTILPVFAPNDWVMLIALLIIIGFALFGAASAAGYLSVGLARYAKFASRTSLVVTVLASFSFFGPQFNIEAETTIAKLRTSLKVLHDHANELKNDAEAAALEMVVAEITITHPIADVVQSSQALIDFHSSWAAQEKRTRSLLHNRFPKESESARRVFWRSEIHGFNELKQNVSESRALRRKSPEKPAIDSALQPSDSFRALKRKKEILSNINFSTQSALVEVGTSGTTQAQDLIRHILKMGYKAAIGGGLEAALVDGVEGLPVEFAKLILKPTILEPLQKLVTGRAEALLENLERAVHGKAQIANGNFETSSREIKQRISEKLRKDLRFVTDNTIREEVLRFSRAVDAVLEKGKITRNDLLEAEALIREAVLIELKSEILSEFGSRWEKEFRNQAISGMSHLLDSIDSKLSENAPQRLLEYRAIRGNGTSIRIDVPSVLQLESKYSSINYIRDLHEKQTELRKERKRIARERALAETKAEEEERKKAAFAEVLALVAKAAAREAEMEEFSKKNNEFALLVQDYWDNLRLKRKVRLFSSKLYRGDVEWINKDSFSSEFDDFMKVQSQIRPTMVFDYEAGSLSSNEALIKAFLKERSEITTKNYSEIGKANTDHLFDLLIRDIRKVEDIESERDLLLKLSTNLISQIGSRPTFDELKEFTNSYLPRSVAAKAANDLTFEMNTSYYFNYILPMLEPDPDLIRAKAQLRRQNRQNRGRGVRRSDRRLKTAIVPTGMLQHGMEIYRFRYRGDEKCYVGLMAQDLLKNPRHRGAVSADRDGYYVVDYALLGFRMMTCTEWDQNSGQRAGMLR